MESCISKARELRSFLQTRGHHHRVSYLKITRSNLSFRENTLAKAQRVDCGRDGRGEKPARDAWGAHGVALGGCGGWGKANSRVADEDGLNKGGKRK